MVESHLGVGVNGEPDDFAARYDRMVTGSGTAGWVLKTILAGLLLLLLMALAGRAIGDLFPL